MLTLRQFESDVTAGSFHVAAEEASDGRRFDHVETHLTPESARLPVLRTANRIGHHPFDSVRTSNVYLPVNN